MDSSYNYFLLALILAVFFLSKWVRPIVQSILHGLVYTLVGCSATLRRSGELLYYQLHQRMPKRWTHPLQNPEEAEAEEEDAIEMWNLSISSELVDYVVFPLSLFVQNLIALAVLDYVIDQAQQGNDGPFGSLSSDSISAITIVSIVVKTTTVLSGIYMVLRFCQAILAQFFSWKLWDHHFFSLPTYFLQCMRFVFRKVRSSRNTSNANNHPALQRLHATQLAQDFQQENFATFFDTIMQALGCIVVFLMVFSSLGIDMTPVWGAVGIGALAVAWASTLVIQNMLGTAAIFIGETHGVGDIVVLPVQQNGLGAPQQIQGEVKRIGALFTTLYGYDGCATNIPNYFFTQNVARVWRASDMKAFSQTFIFGKGTTAKQLKAFKIRFRKQLNEYVEIDPNKSYYWLLYMDLSTTRYQVCLYASDEGAYEKGPTLLYKITQASQARSDCDPSLDVMRLAAKQQQQNKGPYPPRRDGDKKAPAPATSSSLTAEAPRQRPPKYDEEEDPEGLEDPEVQAERLREQEETETSGNRTFFNAAFQFYEELMQWCKDEGCDAVETSLYI
jgi:small-conductance mechanosensitive channel